MAQQQGPNKRTMVVLCVILGILAVVAVFRFASLSGGGGDDSGSTAAPAAASQTPPTTAAATTVTTEPPGEPVVPTGDFDALATRDPFEPVVELNPAPASQSSGSSATSTPASSSSPAGGSATPPTPAPSGTRVLLVDVVDVDGVIQAQLQVNGQPVTVAPGQTFATSFKLVSISGACAQLLYGDAPFSLCKGEEAVK